jgi:hypothetical protein
MPDWLVELQGEEIDLEALKGLLASSYLNVSKEGDTYYLGCSGSISSPDEVRERAREILQRASAAERIRCGSSLPIKLGEVFRIEVDGTRRPFFSSALRISWTVSRQMRAGRHLLMQCFRSSPDHARRKPHLPQVGTPGSR